MKTPRNRPAGSHGFSIIEAMVAATILAVFMTSIAWYITLYLGVMADNKLTSQVNGCLTGTLEYFLSLPPDYAYQISSGAPIPARSFDASYGDEKLNSWLDINGDNRCRQLSRNPSVELKYKLCIGCYMHTVSAGLSANCIYDVRVELEWNSPYLKGKTEAGGNQHHIRSAVLKQRGKFESSCFQVISNLGCEWCPNSSYDDM